MKFLDGEVEDPQIAKLTAELTRMRRELSDAQLDAARAREDANRALLMLRKQLNPLYRALQAVFGELEAAGIAEDAPTASNGNGRTDARVSQVWDSWKSRMGAAAPVIDALLLHGAMNTSQIAIAIGRSRKTVPALMFKLKGAGLIVKKGQKFSLKNLTDQS